MASDCIPEPAIVSQATNRADYLSRSHFRICQDEACTDPCLESVFKRDYPPWEFRGKPDGIAPPPPVQLHHQDERYCLHMRVIEMHY